MDMMQSLSTPDSLMPGREALEAIRSHIDSYNRERPGIYRRCEITAWLVIGGYLLLWLLVLSVVLRSEDGKTWLGAMAVFAIAGGVWVWGKVWQPLQDHQLGLRYTLFPQLLEFIGDVRYSAGTEPYFLETLKQLKLIDFARSKNDDVIGGVHDGMEFELVETELIIGSGKSERTMFKGLIFRFSLVEAFPGMLIANKRQGWWDIGLRQLFSSPQHDEVLSNNRRLDETHVFRTNNHRAAAPVIAGPLTSVLTWLGNEWHGGDVRIALYQGEGYLMLPTTINHFALPALDRDVSYESHVKPLVREMVRLLAIAHAVRNVH